MCTKLGDQNPGTLISASGSTALAREMVQMDNAKLATHDEAMREKLSDRNPDTLISVKRLTRKSAMARMGHHIAKHGRP